MISTEIFTPKLKSLGYELIITNEEDLKVLKKYGGITYVAKKEKPENYSATICNCGVRYDYSVKTCFLCGNKKFKYQANFNRKNLEDIYYEKEIEELELTSEEKLQNILKVFSCEVSIIKNHYNFETNDYDFNIKKIKFLMKFVKHEEIENRINCFLYKENRTEKYSDSLLCKELNLTNYYYPQNISNCIFSDETEQFRDDLKEKNLILTKVPYDIFSEKIPEELKKESYRYEQDYQHIFVKNDSLYGTSNFLNLNENFYNFNEDNERFYKLSKFLYNYLIRHEILSINKRYSSPFKVFNQYYISKLQKTKNFYTEELFLTYPVLDNLNPNSLFRLYELTNHKKHPHEFDDLISYIEEVNTKEQISDLDDTIEMYSIYIKKSKNINLYTSDLTINYSILK